MTARSSAREKSPPHSGTRRVRPGVEDKGKTAVDGVASSGRLGKSRLTDLPLMALAANRTTRADRFAPDPQERLEFAVDPDVDVLPGVRANEMQPFHGGLPARYGSDGGVCSTISIGRGGNSDELGRTVHSAVSSENREQLPALASRGSGQPGPNPRRSSWCLDATLERPFNHLNKQLLIGRFEPRSGPWRGAYFSHPRMCLLL